MKKIIASMMFMILLFSGCTQAGQDDTYVITFSHGAPTGSGPAEELEKLPSIIEENTNGAYSMEVYGGGTLGAESDNIEAVEAGALDMAKVGGSTLEGFDDLYGVFGLPFLFDDEDHLYRTMNDTDIIEKLNEETYDKGFIMVGWYPSGARNFYTATDTPILSPEDLEGQNIRVMSSPTSVEMVSLLGGSPTAMSSNETYTALQQGVIDGAENNELALTANSHKDVIKSYSYTEHQMIPDIFIMSTDFYESLSEEDYQAIVDAISESNENFRVINQGLLADSRAEAEAVGVEFYDDIDKEPFKEKVAPMHEDFIARGDEYAELYDLVESVSESEGETDA